MSLQPIDQFAAEIDSEVRNSVLAASRHKVTSRVKSLFTDLPHANELRVQAGLLKQHTLDHLDTYLESTVAAMERNGSRVHFASNEESACRQITDILQAGGVTHVTKSKSMVTEEIELRQHLEKHGIESVETDLGEFIVQLDDDTPSHIVSPIIHKNRRQIAQTFEDHGLGDFNDDPETITRRARKHLRQKFLGAQATITGANIVSAESGRIVIVTNEGNARFGLAGAKIHVVVTGIEKIVPTDRDLALILHLLARSATGQHLSVYTEFVGGPRSANQSEGPEQMHVVFLDNGRSETLGSEYSEALRCLRCGACLNVCPVFRQASGHAYRHTYPGPIGAVLAPNLVGKARFPELADLPKASSLCGACNEVCPVNIPIPDMLLKLRNRGKEEHAEKSQIASPGMGPWASLAMRPVAWRTALTAGHVMNVLPNSLIPHPAAQTWLKDRTLPKWQGGAFRKWMKNREGKVS